MSLVDDLLSGGVTTPTPTSLTRPSFRPPAKPGLSAIRESRPRVNLVEAVAGARESLAEAVRAAAHRGAGVVTIEKRLAGRILGLLAEAEADPFLSGGSGSMDTNDLESLGLKVVGKQSSGNDDPFGGDDEEEEENDLLSGNVEELIPVSSAIVAPSATPGGAERIPDAVLQAMDVLRSSEREVPLGHEADGETPESGAEGSPLAASFGAGESEPSSERASSASGGSPAELATQIRNQMATERRSGATTASSKELIEGNDMVSVTRRMRANRPKPARAAVQDDSAFLAKIAGLSRS